MNLKKLSEEEKKWLKKIAQKSDLLKIQSPRGGESKSATNHNLGLERNPSNERKNKWIFNINFIFFTYGTVFAVGRINERKDW